MDWCIIARSNIEWENNMITWVLILTMSMANRAAAIDHIPDFKTKAECQAAGDAWIATRSNDYDRFTRYSTICIGKTK